LKSQKVFPLADIKLAHDWMDKGFLNGKVILDIQNGLVQSPVPPLKGGVKSGKSHNDLDDLVHSPRKGSDTSKNQSPIPPVVVVEKLAEPQPVVEKTINLSGLDNLLQTETKPTEAPKKDMNNDLNGLDSLMDETKEENKN